MRNAVTIVAVHTHTHTSISIKNIFQTLLKNIKITKTYPIGVLNLRI